MRAICIVFVCVSIWGLSFGCPAPPVSQETGSEPQAIEPQKEQTNPDAGTTEKRSLAPDTQTDTQPDTCLGDTCHPGKTCSSSCKTHADCNTCEQLSACVQGTCQPISTGKKTGDYCDPSQDDKACASGYFCLSKPPLKVGVCVRQCEMGSDTCAQESKGAFCVAQIPGKPGFCMQHGKQGDTCDPDFPYVVCVGDTPDPSLACDSSRRCVPSIQDQKDGACQPSFKTKRVFCDGRKGLVCDPRDNATCKEATMTQKEGDACDPTGEVLGKRTICDGQAGLFCIPFSVSTEVDLGTGKIISFKAAGRCHRACVPGQTNACASSPGTQCANPFPGIGQSIEMKRALGVATFACLQVLCGTDADCKLPGYKCQTMPAGSKWKSMCAPGESKDQAMGKRCDATKDNSCPDGWNCLSLPGKNEGLCSKSCMQDSDCPGYLGDKSIPSKCAELGPNVKRCMFPCAPTDPKCPGEMSCVGNGQTNLCGIN